MYLANVFILGQGLNFITISNSKFNSLCWVCYVSFWFNFHCYLEPCKDTVCVMLPEISYCTVSNYGLYWKIQFLFLSNSVFFQWSNSKLITTVGEKESLIPSMFRYYIVLWLTLQLSLLYYFHRLCPGTKWFGSRKKFSFFRHS